MRAAGRVGRRPSAAVARPVGLVLCWVASGCAGDDPAVDPGAPPPVPRIVIDGRFDDWAGCDMRPDPVDARGAELDLGAVCVADDAEALYLSVDFGHEVNVQGLRGMLSLRFDADGDSTTGGTEGTLPGVDLVLEFSPPDSEPPGASREGVRLRYPFSGTLGDPRGSEEASAERASEPYYVGLLFEPRHATRRVEIRLERGTMLPGGVEAFRGAHVRGSFEYADSAGRTVDATAPFLYEWETGQRPAVAGPRPAAGREAGSAAVERRPGTAFRALSWNVSQTSLVENAERFRRVLGALGPDLVLLDEVAADTELEWLHDFFASLGDAWHVHRGSSGGRERQVIALRGDLSPRAGLAPAPELARLAYPDSLLRPAERPAGGRDVPVTAPAQGAPATGAWVTVDGRVLLVVSLDLHSGGNRRDAREERVRRIEADVIQRAATQALLRPPRAGVDGVIVGGDFNLVGTETPLIRIARALDPSGGALEAVYALQLDGRSTATWDGGSGRFPPGQLDYVLYSPATLVPLGAFVLETRDMEAEWLATHGLAAEDSQLASDHLPIVVDFAWRTR